MKLPKLIQPRPNVWIEAGEDPNDMANRERKPYITRERRWNGEGLRYVLWVFGVGIWSYTRLHDARRGWARHVPKQTAERLQRGRERAAQAARYVCNPPQ